MERYPHVQRLWLTQALALAAMPGPAPQACALALLCSLLDEGAPFQEDARLLGARLALALRLPALGLRILAGEAPASVFHRDGFAAAAQALAEVEERPLSAWFPGVASVARGVLGAVSGAAGGMLAIGPTAALAALYQPAPWRFWLDVPPSGALAKRFGRAIPATCVLAEPQLPGPVIRGLVESYVPLGFSRIVAVAAGEAIGDLPGFETEVAALAIPPGAPVTLADARCWQAPALEAPVPAAAQGDAAILSVWRRLG